MFSKFKIFFIKSTLTLKLLLDALFKPVTNYIESVYKSSSDEYKYHKSFVGLLMGISTTLCFHLLTTRGLDFSDSSQRLLTILVGCFLCIGGILTIQFRCIMLLLFPTFFGTSCRRFLIVLIVAQLAQGPMQNIYTNLKEAVKSFSCAGEMAINMTLNRLELIFEPVHDIIRAIVVASHDIESQMVSISDALYPLYCVLEKNDFIDKQLDKLKSLSKVEYLSQKLLKQIEELSEKKISKPSENLSIKLRGFCLKIMLGPIKICEKIDVAIKIHYTNLGVKFEGSCPPEIYSFCDDVEDIGEEFDDAYLTLKSLIHKIDEVVDIDIDMDIMTALEILDLDSIKHFKNQMEDEITYRAKVIGYLSKLFSGLLGLLFFTIFISAAKYENKYMNKIDHDNRYVTAYFEKIDKRRKEQNKINLLPLTHLESLELIKPTRFRLLPDEKRKMVMSFTRIFPNFLVAFLSFLLDAAIAYILNLATKHANFYFEGKGEHEIYFEIVGNTFIANQWRDLFQTTTYRHSVHMNITSQNCLPKVTYLDSKYIMIVAGIFVLLLLSSRLEAYGLRLRRIVCSICYYKREKSRILWLYNIYLKRRIGLLDYQKKKILKYSKWNENKKNGKILLIIRETWPKYFSWLKFFNAGKRECLLCQAKEMGSFITCFLCRNNYCEVCWNYLNKKCIPCNSFSSFDNDDYVNLRITRK